jgi:hypothetical protein
MLREVADCWPLSGMQHFLKYFFNVITSPASLINPPFCRITFKEESMIRKPRSKSVFLVLFLLMMSMVSISGYAQTGMVSGYKFNDLNGNGIDDNEPRVPGVRIILASVTDPTMIQERTTMADGSYAFTGLPLGRYEVCEIVPVATPPWTPTTPSCVMVRLMGKVPEATVRFGNRQLTNGDGLGCVRTQGFWGNSPAGRALLVELVGAGLYLGNTTYTAAQLHAILAQPVRGNALLILSKQLIAAKLNVLNGANAAQISASIASADALIGNLVAPPVGSDVVTANSALGLQMTNLAAILDAYNNGRMNVPRCL